MTASPLTQFLQAIQDAGYTPPPSVEADGSPKVLKNAIDAQQNGVSIYGNDEHLSQEELTVVAGVV